MDVWESKPNKQQTSGTEEWMHENNKNNKQQRSEKIIISSQHKQQKTQNDPNHPRSKSCNSKI